MGLGAKVVDMAARVVDICTIYAPKGGATYMAVVV
jgi:hypothetical protein